MALNSNTVKSPGYQRPRAYVISKAQRQSVAAQQLDMVNSSQILFGDLHFHTSLSPDDFILSMPMAGGEDVRPPSDACDYARYCSEV